MTGRHLPHDWFARPLPDNVILGPRSWLYSSFAFIHCRSRAQPAVSVGSDSGVYHNCFFELGESGSVSIGDYCTLVGATIITDGAVVIEDNAFVAHEVVIADDPFAMPCRRAGATAARPAIRLGRNCWIGTRAVLLAGADIGADAIVGAGCVVDFAVAPGAVVAGNPARIVRRC